MKWYHVDSNLITSLWNDTSNSEVSRVRISATTESQIPVIFSFPLQNRDVILASKTNRMSRKRQTIDAYKNPVSDFSKFTKSENVPTALMAHCYHSCSRHFRNRSSSSLSRAVILRSSLSGMRFSMHHCCCWARSLRCIAVDGDISDECSARDAALSVGSCSFTLGDAARCFCSLCWLVLGGV